MHGYEHRDVSLYESGKPFIWDEYETFIFLRPSKPAIPGSNPGGRTTQQLYSFYRVTSITSLSIGLMRRGTLLN
jgi:hypothetical protein